MIETAKIRNLPLKITSAVFLSVLLTAKQLPTGKNSSPGTLKLRRSSLAASGKMIKRKKHPVIGCFFFVQILVCFDGYNMVTYKDWRFL